LGDTHPDLILRGSDAGCAMDQRGCSSATLSDGRFELVQEADHPVRWPVFTGTYTGNGTRVSFVTETPLVFAGRVERLRWMLEGGNLRFEALDDDVYVEVHWESDPWVPQAS